MWKRAVLPPTTLHFSARASVAHFREEACTSAFVSGDNAVVWAFHCRRIASDILSRPIWCALASVWSPSVTCSDTGSLPARRSICMSPPMIYAPPSHATRSADCSTRSNTSSHPDRSRSRECGRSAEADNISASADHISSFLAHTISAGDGLVCLGSEHNCCDN